jgi:hypothetical protein
MRYRKRALLWLIVGSCAACVPGALAQSVNVTNSTVANGGGVIEAGEFRMLVTMGEPAVSRIAANGFVITSGLQAAFLEGAGLLPDDLFRDGFENPPPPGPPSGESP